MVCCDDFPSEFPKFLSKTSQTIHVEQESSIDLSELYINLAGFLLYIFSIDFVQTDGEKDDNHRWLRHELREGRQGHRFRSWQPLRGAPGVGGAQGDQGPREARSVFVQLFGTIRWMLEVAGTWVLTIVKKHQCSDFLGCEAHSMIVSQKAPSIEGCISFQLVDA